MAFLSNTILPIVLSGLILGGVAAGQAGTAQTGATSPVATPPAAKTALSTQTRSDVPLDAASLIPDPPPLPTRARASLIGGTINKLDRVRDEIAVRPFGGGKLMKIFFDPRTRVYRGSSAATISDLRKGDRIYVDTILDGSTVFARNIRLSSNAASGVTEGILLRYRRGSGELEVRDPLSPQPLKMVLTSNTRLTQDGHLAQAGSLVPGTLMSVQFTTDAEGHDVASEVSIFAVPGSSYTFSGRVVALDLHVGLLVLTSSADSKTYEIYLDPATTPVDDSLRQGVDATVLARFEGDRYVAHEVSVNSPHTP